MNTAVMRGEAVTFECTSNVSGSVISWYNSLCLNIGNTPACSSDLIYSSFSGTLRYDPSRFSVTAVNNATHITRDLNINPTQLTDAGFYLCAEVNGADVTDTSSAQLVVLGMKMIFHTIDTFFILFLLSMYLVFSLCLILCMLLL